MFLNFFGGWVLPYILLNKATHLLTHYFFIIVNQMQILGNNGGFEFCDGWVLSYILLEVTHLPVGVVSTGYRFV